LRMPLLSDFMVHRARAVGKCQYQMPYSCAIGMYQGHDPGLDVGSGLQGLLTYLTWKETTSSA
jgi:hypothetical protein